MTLPFEISLVVDTLRVRFEDHVLHIHGEGTLPRNRVEGYGERLDLFRQALEEELGQPVVLEVEAVPVDVLNFRSAPDGLADQ